MEDGNELKNLPKETLEYLGLLDENGELKDTKNECATQVLSEPTDQTFMSNPAESAKPSLKKKNNGVASVGLKPETGEKRSEKKSVSSSLKRRMSAVRESVKARFAENKPAKVESAEYPDEVQMRSVYDALLDWPVIEGEGFHVELTDDSAEYESFVLLDEKDREHVEFTVYCDGTLKHISSVPEIDSDIRIPIDESVELAVKKIIAKCIGANLRKKTMLEKRTGAGSSGVKLCKEGKDNDGQQGQKRSVAFENRVKRVGRMPVLKKRTV